ncbi:MAG: kinase/pyrophosphorylase [Candidatus Aminicenantes bacterium]|nr:kinase/pyrophosphorylase [Candidatus Aminicenantes bacterium]
MGEPPPGYKRYVFAVSDATGKTCETVVLAALSQFKTTQIVLETLSNVRSLRQIQEVFRRATLVNGVIIYTMASPELRHKITELGRLNGVPTVDILGPVLTRLSDLLEISPLAKPGLFHQLDSDYFKRIEAVDFTIQHDDGRGLATIGNAEIVLLGVSRTSKTPVSIYLSYRGWKVANIPVVLDEALPEEVHHVDQRKIIALSIRPKRLEAIRRERQAKLQAGEDSYYADGEHIRREVLFALQQYERRQWPVLDATYKSIEETATEVMRLVYARSGLKKGSIAY